MVLKGTGFDGFFQVVEELKGACFDGFDGCWKHT